MADIGLDGFFDVHAHALIKGDGGGVVFVDGEEEGAEAEFVGARFGKFDEAAADSGAAEAAFDVDFA